MNMSQPFPLIIPELDIRTRTRNGYYILATLMFAALPTGALFAYFGYVNNYPRLYVISGMLAANFLIDFWLLSLLRKGNIDVAMSLALSLFLVDMLAVPFVIQNMGIIISFAAFTVTLAISGLTLSPSNKMAGIISGILFGTLAFALDSQLGNDRLNVPEIQAYTPYIVAPIVILILYLTALEFKNFGLRIKVALGILVTGAVSISALAAFGLIRANSLIISVEDKFEGSIAAQIKSEISNTTQTKAQNADNLFASTLDHLQALARYQENLLTREDIFSQGVYWNGSEKVTQLSNGNYGNSSKEPVSIFIPGKYANNDAMWAELNTTAYLDFAALNFLDANPRVQAIYFISATGATTYYPNINLAELLDKDFDPLVQPFFTIANPQNNPERLPRWTAPYQDPAGAGMVATLAIPVYVNNSFKGVLGADLKMAQILEEISSIKFGLTGFAFLVDKEGRILAMPQQGYDFFGLQPETVLLGESPKQSIFDKENLELHETMLRIVNGEIGVVEARTGNTTYYMGFRPLSVSGYRLAAIVPKEEMIGEITATRKSIESEKSSSLQAFYVLLLFFFVFALAVSLIIGQVITSPLIRLTKTVEQIAGGDLSARAVVETRDETGRLAASVNTMNDELKSILANLEERVSDRTRELEKTNELIARRAAQFEIIARIARTISSTQTMDALLPQIVETISKQFNFYHVGIFLVDSRHEYAILVAANSEGGKKMLARNHRLMIGETGIVGYVTSVGQPRVALDVGSDAHFFNNPDLPDTHSEIALPLRIGAETFGALDVQSTESDAFSEEDISILTTLADQVSIAIQNARSYQQSREALAQAERVTSQLSGQQWRRFIEQQRITGYHFDGTDTKMTLPGKTQGGIHQISIPLLLRGAQIGAIKVNASNPNHEWNDDELAMIQAAADRAALALENARLLEESQKRAAKERTIGDISARIGSVADLETIIQTAMLELGNTLPGTDIAIQFTDAPAKQ
jgi:GAF domain-containing protein/HAMP domain-containing protein